MTSAIKYYFKIQLVAKQYTGGIVEQSMPRKYNNILCCSLNNYYTDPLTTKYH